MIVDISKLVVISRRHGHDIASKSCEFAKSFHKHRMNFTFFNGSATSTTTNKRSATSSSDRKKEIETKRLERLNEKKRDDAALVKQPL